MTNSFVSRFTLTALISVVGLAACSPHNAGSSRYGGEQYLDCGAACVQETVKQDPCCGYYMVPVHHIYTEEKQVEVEVEKIVVKEVVKELPPQIVYKNAPCPSDTMADANGACIRYVDRPQPPVYVCQRPDGLPCKK